MAHEAEPWLGIDFGTCRTRAAILIGGELRKVDLAHGAYNRSYDMPTAVYIRESGEILVGEQALHTRFRDPSRYHHQFKLDIANSRGVTALVNGVPKRYAWSELVGAILLHIRLSAEGEYNNGRPFKRAVLTVPAIYTPGGAGTPWSVMEEAGRMAGFEEVRIEKEPHTVAIFYDYELTNAGHNVGPEGETSLVYDLGGGTFDPALIRRSGHTFEILRAQSGKGILCGGTFFDQAIREHFSQQCPEIIKNLKPALRTADGVIQQADALSAARYERDRIGLEGFLIDLKHRFADPWVNEVEEFVPLSSDTVYRLTRAEFDALLSPMLDETIGCCVDLMRLAGIGWQEISRILLVGGSCHLPLVGEKLRASAHAEGAHKTEICWKRIVGTNRILDPSFATCMGATLAPLVLTPLLKGAGNEAGLSATQSPASTLRTAPVPKPAMPNRTDYRVENDPFGVFLRKRGDAEGKVD